MKSSLLKHKPVEFIKVSKPQVKNINYLDLSGQCSKVVDFRQRHEKKGRPGQKKVLRSKERLCEKKKVQKKREVHCQTESKVGVKKVVLETEVVQLPDDVHGTYTTGA